MLFCGCQLPKTDRLKMPKDREAGIPEPILELVMKEAGGISRWRQLSSVSFKKESILYNENGEIEQEVMQHYQYQIQPDFAAKINWITHGIDHQVNYNNQTLSHAENGTPISATPADLDLVLGGWYVMKGPYNLLENMKNLQMDGNTLINDVAVFVVKINPKTESDHIWWYYFDKSTGDFIASRVFHDPIYAFISNDEMMEISGIKWPKSRTTYRVDGEGRILFKRASFTYSEYDVRFVENQ